MSGAAARLLRSGGPLLGLSVTWLLFAASAGTTFTQWSNHEIMLLQTAVVGIAAIGATWIIVGGGIDLSVGSNIAVAGMVGASVLREGFSWPVAAAATIAAGALVGATIGALVVGALARTALAALAAVLAAACCSSLPPLARVGVAFAAAAAAWGATRKLAWSLPLSPFIVTLGLWGALRGLAKGIGGNQPIYFPGNDDIKQLMMPGGALLPIGVWVLLGSMALAALALRTTVFGRHVRALGSNREAARLSGVDVVRTELLVYVVGGTCAGVAAVLQLAYLSMGDPTTAQGYELKAIAAAVIGGASLAGGEGSIFGTLLGALVMTVVDNGCTKVGLDNWVQEVVTGAIIVAAVALDRWRQARR
jgi:ribose/xylose/arabinose/galactoside ABC-type transport system permease subunit